MAEAEDTFGSIPARIDYAALSREAASLSIEDLNKKAWQCVRLERYDSAAAYYSMAASRFSESLPLEDKKRCAVANLNLGYVWQSWRMNAPEAYPRLMKARDIAEKYGFEDIESYVLSNLGQIYFDYNSPSKGAELQREALKRIIVAGKDRYFGQNLIDYVSAALAADRADLLVEDFPEISAYTFSDSVALHEYSRRMIRAMRSLVADKPGEAAGILEESEPYFDLPTESKRYLSLHYLIVGRLHMLSGDYLKARNQFLKMTDTASRAGYYNLLEKGFAYMEECCRKLGLDDEMRQCQDNAVHIRDSLFNASRFEIVKDLETAAELQDLHDNIRKAAVKADIQRQRVIWFATTSALLLVAVIVLVVWQRRLRQAYRNIYIRNMELTDMRKQYGVIACRPSAGAKSCTDDDVSAADEEQMRQTLEQVISVMENGGEIFDPEFSVDRMAALIGKRPKQMSQAVNVVTGKNFNTLLGEYRIREACRILSDPDTMKVSTMETVAEMTGYRSRTHFSSVFKNVTGLTPTQFVKQSRMDK